MSRNTVPQIGARLAGLAQEVSDSGRVQQCPRVSVRIMTYNHEAFIAQCIESVAEQRRTFGVEVVVGVDVSTDRTRELCLECQAKHPDMIRLLLMRKRVGRAVNYGLTMGSCRGQYVALLDGDDQWTDPLKLQRQVDYLDSHPTAAGCFHDSVTLDARGQRVPGHFGRSYKSSYTQRECLTSLGASYATSSLMFRRRVLSEGFPPYFLREGCDFLLDLLITEHGTLDHLAFNGAAYRVHSGGVWQGTRASVQKRVMLRRLAALRDEGAFIRRYEAELDALARYKFSAYWQALKDEGNPTWKRMIQCAFRCPLPDAATRLATLRRLENLDVRRKLLRAVTGRRRERDG